MATLGVKGLNAFHLIFFPPVLSMYHSAASGPGTSSCLWPAVLALTVLAPNKQTPSETEDVSKRCIVDSEL